MHVTTQRRQRQWYNEYSLRQLRTMGSEAPVGGDGGVTTVVVVVVVARRAVAIIANCVAHRTVAIVANFVSHHTIAINVVVIIAHRYSHRRCRPSPKTSSLPSSSISSPVAGHAVAIVVIVGLRRCPRRGLRVDAAAAAGGGGGRRRRWGDYLSMSCVEL